MKSNTKKVYVTRVFQLLVVAALFCAVSSSICAEESGPQVTPFSLKALLISLEDYEKAELKYARPDLDELSDLLMYDYGCTTTIIYNKPVTAGTGTEEKDTHKRSIEKSIVQWCQSLKADDIALIYLAGHGVQDDAGRLYIPMLNFKASNLDDRFQEAAIPVSWIREQFEKAECKSRLVFIDACYSGTAKAANNSPEHQSGGTYALAKSFNESGKSSTKVTTIASSDKDQKSWLWREEKHSLFTYWLIEALKGAADTDNDCLIKTDELFNFLRIHVSRISRLKARTDMSMEPQIPVLLNGDIVENQFVIPCPVKKMSDSVLSTLESIDKRLRQKNLVRIMVVPEFKTGLSGDTIDSSRYGLLPSWIAEEIRSNLAAEEYEEKPYSVIQQEQSRLLLRKHELTPGDMGTDREQILLKEEQIDAVIEGSIHLLSGQKVYLHIVFNDLRNKEHKEYKYQIHLNASEMAALGIAFRPAERQHQSESAMVHTDDGVMNKTDFEDSQVIDRQQKAKYNPMADQTLPFGITIGTRPAGSTDNYKARKGKIKDGKYYIPVTKGHEFAIFIKNFDKSEPFYFVKVLVDGLNTISQQMPTSSSRQLDKQAKDLFVEPAHNRDGIQVLAPFVSLEKARPWLIFNGENKENSLNIYGFYDEKGSDTKGYRFLLGDSDDSLAARQHYTDKVGMITAAFYKAVLPEKKSQGPSVRRSRRKIGTQQGQQFESDTEVFQGKEVVGDLKAVYQIYYISQEEFDKMFTVKTE